MKLEWTLKKIIIFYTLLFFATKVEISYQYLICTWKPIFFYFKNVLKVFLYHNLFCKLKGFI